MPTLLKKEAFSAHFIGSIQQLYSYKQFSNLQTTNFALQYAYHIDTSSEHSLSLGMQGGFSSRGVDVNSLVTGDQISSFLSTGSLGSNMSDPLLSQLRPNVHYADFSTGALFNTKNYWIGASVHHLNAPNKTLINNTEDIIPPKYSLQMGMKIMLENSFYNADQDNPNNERSISPVLQYKQQGIFKQVDLGAYLTLSPLVIGAWYRGIPMEKLSVNRESVVGLIGYKQDNFSIGYSYDLTVSSLGVNAGGAHEISLAYLFDFGFSMKKNPRIGKRTLSCPKF